MDPFPHKYVTRTIGQPSGSLVSTSRQSPKMHISEPLEFNGSDDQWSPEQIFVACVTNCLILTFRAITHASKFSWVNIACEAEGKLDRVNGVNQFTHIDIQVFLSISSDIDKQKALRLLTKAENQCLIKNSITSQVNFINNVDYI